MKLSSVGNPVQFFFLWTVNSRFSTMNDLISTAQYGWELCLSLFIAVHCSIALFAWHRFSHNVALECRLSQIWWYGHRISHRMMCSQIPFNDTLTCVVNNNNVLFKADWILRMDLKLKFSLVLESIRLRSVNVRMLRYWGGKKKLL